MKNIIAKQAKENGIKFVKVLKNLLKASFLIEIKL